MALDVVVGHCSRPWRGDGAAQARLPSGSPPDLAAMVISLIQLREDLAALASSAPFCA